VLSGDGGTGRRPRGGHVDRRPTSEVAAAMADDRIRTDD
jgi:hypothetical protein